MSVGLAKARSFFIRHPVIRRIVDLRSRLPVANSSLFIAFLASVMGCFPLFAGPSYPSALLFGLIVPSITAVSTSLINVPTTTVEGQFGLALRRAGAHALALTLPLCFHAIRVGWCDPLHELVLLGLGPLMGLVMAAAFGITTNLLRRRFVSNEPHRTLAVIVALAGPLGGIALGLSAFYSSPIVYAFDPFVGFFAGSPYDTGFDPTLRLVTYRTGSVGTLLGLFAFLRQLEFDPTHKPRFRKNFDRPILVLGLFGLGLSVALTTEGVALDHRSTTESLRTALGQNLRVGRCEVVYSAQQKRSDVERLATDCDAWLVRLERRLRTAKLEQVTAFVFDGPAQKELLMGAAHTQIAKPWRREIYLNGATYPDDVVGHELAHIVAGQVARGPFAVAGSFFGLIPNPGLIEGLAVALAPDEDGDLTPTEWARTLMDLGQLPAILPLFSLSFFEHSGTLAYTVAGAFVEFIGQSFGKPAVRAWYRGKSLESVTGASFATLEQRFKDHLRTVNVPKDATNAALARFARQGVFSRRCPHAVDRALDAADQMLRKGDAQAACQLYGQANALDPTEIAARFGLGDCARRRQQTEQALIAYRTLANDSSLPAPTRERATELLADLLFESKQLEPARVVYTKLAESTLDAARRRSLEIKARADCPEAVTALSSLLIGQNGETAWDVAVRDLILWSEAVPKNGIADYLLGRNFWAQGREAAAVQHLERALTRNLEPPDVEAEAIRLRAVMACAQRDGKKAIALADRLATEPHMMTPRRLGLLRLVERCAGRLVFDDWPETAEVAKNPAKFQGSSTQSLVAKSDAFATDKRPWESKDFTCPDGMVKIPGSTFWMGSQRGTNSDDETPRFQTRVKGFCLDRTEVTVGAYRMCVEKGECLPPATNESKRCNYSHGDRFLHPINCVSYEQADNFCKRRQARLPTEIEWEYSARGGPRALRYPWGDGSPDGRACWKNFMTCPVMTYAAGVFDLYDMTGNVWEWTSSDYAPYPFPAVPGETHQKVYRGGSWSRRFEKWMHVGLRNRWNQRESGSHLGFRCAKSVDNLTCPSGADEHGQCLQEVLAADCPTGQTWNGYRCASPNAPLCDEGDHADRAHGCVRDVPLIIRDHPLDIQAVQRQRSPEFDSDCRVNQPKRPQAYRYFGGEHAARNLVARQSDCKNRDVGAGWNSVCCP